MDAWEGNYAVDVKNFAAFDFAIFCFVICVGKKLADRGHAGATVSIMDGFIGIEAVRRAHQDQTRTTAGVESIRTPSMSNKSALQKIFGIGYDSQKVDAVRKGTER